MTRRLIFSIMLLASAAARAQMMTVNDERTKFEGGVQYRGGTPVEGATDGHLYTNEALWHNFVFTPLRKYGVELHHQYNDGGNHYTRLGVNAQEVLMLPGYKGIALTANLYGEGSNRGFHHFDGVVSTLFMYNMDPSDTRAAGFIFLLNNPSKMCALPIFTWNRKFSDKFDLDFMTYMATFSYHLTKRWKLSAAYSCGFETYWQEQPNGDEYMFNRISFTPTLSVHFDVAKNFTVGAIGGYQIPIMGSVYNECGKRFIHKLDTYNSPIAQAQLYYRF